MSVVIFHAAVWRLCALSTHFRQLLAALLLVFAAVLASGSAAQSKPALNDDELQLARQFLAAGRFMDTITVLSSREYTPEHRNDAFFILGLASVEQAIRESDEKRKKALLEQAVSAFRTLLVRNPNLVRVRLELARAFFLQENDGLAREQFERVLAGSPPPAVQANINRFLQAIKSRRKLRASVSVRVIRDSNYNNAAADKTIWLRFGGTSLPFQSSSAPPKSGVGAIVSGRAEYRHPMTDSLNILAGAETVRTEFPGADSDRTVLEFFGGPEYQLNPDHDVSLVATAAFDVSARAPNRRYGARLQTGHVLGPRTFFGTRAGVFKRTYRSPSLTRYNANELEFGVNLRHRLSPTLTLDGGVALSSSNPKAVPDNRSQTVQGTLGMSSLLRNGYTAGLSATLARTSYKGMYGGVPTIDGRPRSDRSVTFQATLLHRDFTILGFSPQLALIHEKLNSNAQAVDYSSNRAQVNLIRQF